MSLSAATLKSATDGFDHFFAGNIDSAREVFQKNAQDPYHQLGLAVCSFLEAAMSMETVDTARAESSIAESLRLSSKYRQSAQLQKTTRFPAGLEWDVLIADATVLSGLIHVFSETYLGYARCM
ncbi:hypothetical protein AX14_013081 [Amanita brunnescens Koide BX004]|nr:hypothetical protein AX14_013081 [Amanita brunnescens Koide BX004]